MVAVSTTLKPDPLTPDYRYNSSAGRYIDSRGRFVSNSDIRKAVDAVIVSAKAELPKLTQQLVDGKLSLPEWQTKMASNIRVLHTSMGAAAKGGWANMKAADFGRVGQLTRTQYVYLNRFAIELESGKQKLGQGAVYRSTLYGEAGRKTYEVTKRIVMDEQGFDEERNVLGEADHCEDCLDATSQGWVPIGTLIPVGDRVCRTKCHCETEYRKRPN